VFQIVFLTEVGSKHSCRPAQVCF